MTIRTVTVYLNEETGEAFYVDCPACHFFKNQVSDIGNQCRNMICKPPGNTIIKVPVTIQPPLSEERSSCPHDIIFHDENIGSYENPVIEPYVSCDNDNTGCGFSVLFCDDEGKKHDAHDWWVTSADFKRYEDMHRKHTDDQL